VDRGVFSSHFSERSIEGTTTNFRVKAGSYRIGGSRIIEDRRMLVNPTFDNFIASSAKLEPPGNQLEGDPYGGFAFDVDKNVRVVLSLRVSED
jgi:hypothetical protein